MKTKTELFEIAERQNLDLFKSLTQDEKDIIVGIAKILGYYEIWKKRSLKASEENALAKINERTDLLLEEYYS